MKRLLVALVLLCTLAPAGLALASASDAGSGEDRIVVSSPVLVDRDETAGDVFVLDGDVVIRGTVEGDVVVADGDVTIRGEVEGDVVTLAGTATLGRRAVVGGDLAYASNKPVVTRGARVAGETKRFIGEIGAGAGVGIAIGFWLAVTLSLLILGLLLLVLAPRAADAVAVTAKAKAGASIGVGILAFIVLPVLGVIACVTILGLPFGIGLLMALFPLYAIAYVTTAVVLGRRIIKGSAIPAFLVGLVILRLLALIPFVGGLIGLLAMIFGLGVLFVTLFRARSGSAASARPSTQARPTSSGSGSGSGHPKQAPSGVPRPMPTR